MRRAVIGLLAVLVLCVGPTQALAAQVLQVRSATLVQVGDQNRSYGVRLACVELDSEQTAAATAWLRSDLPRRTRVNLKPQGSDDGVLLARVERLDRGSDLAVDLVDAGFGQLLPGCQT